MINFLAKGRFWRLAFIVTLITILSISIIAKQNLEYDGLWFLGFNLHKDIFHGSQGKLIRQAIAHALDRQAIIEQMGYDTIVPDSIIPPGRAGYADYASYPHDLKRAKELMQQAGFSMTDRRLKEIRLLHTNGVKTKAAANKLKEQLKHIGIKVLLTGVDYSDQAIWRSELSSGQYHLFLMGFKAEQSDDILTFLKPLFHSEGIANFTYYNSSRVDNIISKTETIDDLDKRALRLKILNRYLSTDLPVLGIFYIKVF
jgi:peptide/nickel transport system substrate-binding protein